MISPDLSLDFEQTKLAHLLWRINFGNLIRKQPIPQFESYPFDPTNSHLESLITPGLEADISGLLELAEVVKSDIATILFLLPAENEEKVFELLQKVFATADSILSILEPIYFPEKTLELSDLKGSTIQWNSNWELGIGELDSQHKSLVSIINELQSAILAGSDSKTLCRILYKLEDYTRLHFTTEEIYIKYFGYPGLKGHQKQHNIFIDYLVQFRLNLSSGFQQPQDLYTFLLKWLIFHISRSDKDFMKFQPKSDEKSETNRNT
ncbi:MAG: hemerythrin family protein [Bacteroidetes bacterium]|nr:hemerythrin family protein [Bacteroidota bacterium]